ncbi:MAG: class I SAM-dependent methyltransferase [Thermodesulfobacteria bacterium]|nr:class I SAM-dependent methyltransferase [Thermodesulfobacteriota bacterium]
MRRFRRKYYDVFSHFYDAIIALHSRDRRAYLRRFLLKKAGVKEDTRLLDLCTGTGAVPLAAAEIISEKGLIVGVDFSCGMLKQAVRKAGERKHPRLFFVLADVGELPFPRATFEVVTCSHAMYELDPETRDRALEEVKRVLAPGGCFAMMEHCEPKNPFVRLLYRLRLASMGSPENRAFARDERPFLKRHFREVKRLLSPTGGSKLLLAYV